MRAATRGSPLARWQTDHVASLLAAAGVQVEVVVVETSGDRDPSSPVSAIGGQGVFVKEVQAAVLDGRADIAVHSAKDLPSLTADGLVLASVPTRGDSRDALVGSTLAGLGTGARVGTGSVRRRAQLAHLRSDLTFAELRGNIATRLAKASEFDAIVVAAVALQRLGLSDRMTEALDPSLFVPQVAQGALAIECRAAGPGSVEVQAVLAAIQDPDARRCVDAERAFLAELGGGCSLPVGAHAVVAGPGALALTAILASGDGRVLVRRTATGHQPGGLGREVAAYLLDEAGGRSLLAL